MSDDIVKRLRADVIADPFEKRIITSGALAEQQLIRERHEAADEIEKLRAALKPFADKADKAEGPFEPPYPADYPLWRAARAALGEKE